MLGREQLAKYLDGLDWRTTEHDAGTLKTVHRTSEGEIAIYVRLQDHWLIASVVPFLATQGKNSFELSRWLLRVNRDMYQSKFAYDEDGDVVLTVELPTESIDPSEVRGALKGLLEQAILQRKTLRLASA